GKAIKTSGEAEVCGEEAWRSRQVAEGAGEAWKVRPVADRRRQRRGRLGLWQIGGGRDSVADMR
ncbi:Protein of unknown function, partial [Gryllus bimaculatus]